MHNRESNILRAIAVTAVVLGTIPLSFQNALASSGQFKETRPVAIREPITLYITLCLWSHRPAACRELPLTPGAAGPGFESMQACQDGQEEALQKWFAEAGPVFGFTAMAGEGYRIEAKHCGPIVGGSFDSEQ